MLAYRTPLPPAPIEAITIAHPAVPDGLDGLTILHVSDLHTRRFTPLEPRHRVLRHALASVEPDLIAITGDLMDEPGHERAALDALADLASVWRPRVAALCVFGNHDTPALRRAFPAALPHITPAGAAGGTLDLPLGGATLRVLGLDWPEDPLRVLAAEPPPPPGPVFRLALAHYPSVLVPLSDAGVPLALAAHTHGGQVRLSPSFAPHTSSDLPAHLAAGLLRRKDTLCAITRGLGDGVIDHLRINCPRQLPLYTLRRADLPPARSADAAGVSRVRAW